MYTVSLITPAAEGQFELESAAAAEYRIFR